jgi:glycosyltransferase involved in cell wall biosynthesis
LTSFKILFLTTQLPFPPKSGGTVKSWNFVQFLAKHHQLSIGSLLKGDDRNHLQQFNSAIAIQLLLTEDISISRNPLNLLKSYLLSPSLNVFRNTTTAFKTKVDSIADDFEIIIVDHYEMFQYVPKNFKGKVIMHTHNAEFMLWQRMGELSSNPIKKIILMLEASRVKKYEAHIFGLSDLVFSTPSDIELYRKNGFKTPKHSVTYHLGNDQLLQLKDLEFSATEKAITFIGTLSWEPNIDGLVWFIERCWAAIKTKHPDCKLYILGSSPDQRILNSAKKDSAIIFTGFVENLDDYLQKTRVYIAPLRFGSGMKVKVLEGLYRGVPTVSTSVGAEGLEIENKKEILIADDAADFSSACIELLQNEPLWQQLRDNSRKVAEEKYRWEPLFKKMNLEIEKVAKPKL